ncbi:MAG: hypothetical protein M0P47_10375 [Bacteroidales bacterium]|nr:hypothetical protein [Bacteroidales bacterium]
MCIYLGEIEGLHYDSPDHIIPAGLGGKIKLPSDYVSREFNNMSSKYEKVLLRSSILSLPRQLLGPGKRGSFDPKKATKSRVNVFSQYPETGLLSLGFIKMGKPFEIPHIFLNRKTGEVRVEMDKATTDIELQEFKNQLCHFESLRIRLMKFSRLDSDSFLLGIKTGIEQNFDCFIASHDGKSNPFTAKALTIVANTIENRTSFSDSASFKVTTHQSAELNEGYYRSCAKIAFNCLAYIAGKTYVSNEMFDPIKKWLVEGGENIFVDILPNYKSSIQRIFPEDSHQVVITKIDKELIADVCFYNYFHNKVRIATNFNESFKINGFICNWKEKKEYTLYDFLGGSLIKERMIL